MSSTPCVLFVCVHNAGKSQTAAALLRHLADDAVEVHSAGTDPDTALSRGAVAALAEMGIDTTGESPKPIDAALLARADRVVILGSDAQVAPLDDMAGSIERWVIAAETDPTILDTARAVRVRDEIRERIVALLRELDPVSH